MMNRYINVFLILIICAVAFSQSTYSYSLWSENIRGRSGNAFWWEGLAWFDDYVDFSDTLDVSDGKILLPDSIDGNVVYEDTVTATHFIGNLDATTVTIDTLTSPVITGATAIDNEWNQTYTATSGASVGNIWKTTLSDADTFSGTTGYQFKVYDGGASVLHNGGEHCAVYANMKLLSAMTAGGKSVIYSGHNYDSSIEIDAGMWLYGKLEYGLKISGDTINYGVDLSETAVETADIRLENGATIANSSTGKTVISDTLQSTYYSGTVINSITSYLDSVTAAAGDSIIIGWKYAVPETLVDVR